jgi:hypothetical protein
MRRLIATAATPTEFLQIGITPEQLQQKRAQNKYLNNSWPLCWDHGLERKGRLYIPSCIACRNAETQCRLDLYAYCSKQ